MRLSIVATLYQSAVYITEFHQRASAAARQLVGEEYEIILVNDGSPDNSLNIAVQITERDSHVVVVDLSRNFGHHKAMMTGLAQAKGQLVFLIDSDLEEEPEWVIEFVEQMAIDKRDVVYGVQAQRKGNFFERWSGQYFYRLFNTLTGIALPENIVTARLMSRRYVDALLRHEEREVFMAGLWHITGFTQHPQSVKKHSNSATTYTFRSKMSLLVNSVTSFSNAPLISIFYIGLSISLIAIIYIAYLVIHWLFLARPFGGWTSVMASIWLLGGMVISFIGVIGIYLSKIFSETKQRPYTIIREIYAKPKIGFLNEVAEYYSSKLMQHGATPRGVDWNGEESQTLRFEQLCKLFNASKPFSVNDLGCGYGALYDFLVHRYESFSYLGIDVSEDMIRTAERRYGARDNAHFVFANEPGQVADYGVASGIFNVRLGRSDDEWRSYLETILDVLDRTSRFGFAFNCLTSYSEPDKMRDYLYYADPCLLLDHCKRRYSKSVALLHDYGLYEFTILVRKQP
jgi:putative glycosyltransferase